MIPWARRRRRRGRGSGHGALLGAALLLAAPAAAMGVPGHGVPAASGGSGGGTGGTTGTPAASGAPAGPPPLRLVSQTSWLTAGHTFYMDLATGTTAQAQQLELTVGVFGRLHSRSAFEQTLHDQIGTSLLQGMGPTALQDLPPDPSHPGSVRFSIAVVGPGQRAPASSSSGASHVLYLRSCSGGCAGVYPVRVSLENSRTGQVVDRITTDLVLTGPVPATRKLELAWALGLSQPVTMTHRGRAAMTGSQAQAVAARVGALSAHPSVALSLAPSPATIAALAASSAPQAREALAALRSWASEPEHQVLAGTYVPVDPAALTAAGLGSQLGAQLEAGAGVLDSRLQVRPSISTWVAGAHLTGPALSLLASQPQPDGPVHHLVVPESDLAPLAERITPVQPFVLAGSRPPLEAMTADSVLAAQLAGAGSRPVLTAHQILADLAMIYFDSPNATYARGVVLHVPSQERPDPAVVDLLLGALATSPIIQPVTLDQFFAQVQPATVYGADLVRQLAANPSPPPAIPAGAIRAHLAELEAFRSILASGPSHVPVTAGMANLLLASESSAASAPSRARRLADLSALIQGQLSLVRLPTESVTLTARSGQLPVTIVSRAPYPIRGVLRIRSDGLSFPNHSSSKPIVLTQRNNTAQFEVRAGATGKFPVQIQLLSPRGHLVVATSRFAVRSSAFSLVAIGLTVGAGLVLILWWGYSLVRGRRNRRLVPAGE